MLVLNRFKSLMTALDVVEKVFGVLLACLQMETKEDDESQRGIQPRGKTAMAAYLQKM